MEKETELTPENIKEWRDSSGMTQQQMAEVLGVGVATIARWEAGTAQPTGTAATILKTVLTGSKLKGKDLLKIVPLVGGSIVAAYSIYKLLAEVFEKKDT